MKWLHILAVSAASLPCLASTCGQKDPAVILGPTQLVVVARDAGDDPVNGVDVFVDEILAGSTPLTLDVDPGTYAVRVNERGSFSTPTSRTVDVIAGESVEAAFLVREGFPRTVLLEDFTNAGCIPCVPFEIALQAEIGGYSLDELVVVSLHHNTPGFDPMHLANVPENRARASSYYGIPATPTVATDGRATTAVPPLVADIIADIESQLLSRSPISLDVTATLVGNALEVDVDLTSIADVDGDTRLVAVLIQEDMIFDTAPGSNGVTDFHHVVRDFEPDLDGADVGGETISITEGFTESYSYTLPLLTAANPPDDPAEAEAVVFVQEWSTKAVIQAASTLE